MKNLAWAWVLVTVVVLSVAAGCGSVDMSVSEAETAIKDHLMRMPLAIGVRMKQLNAFKVVKLMDLDEAIAASAIKKGVDPEALKMLEEAGKMKVFYVKTEIDGVASVDAANFLQTGAQGDTPIKGAAWFMLSKNENGDVKVSKMTKLEMEQ